MSIEQALYLGFLPLLGVMLYISSLLYRLRKKRGYKAITIASSLLLIPALLHVIGGFVFHQVAALKLIGYIGEVFLGMGWYTLLVGLFLLNRSLSKRGRMLIYVGSLVWVVLPLIPLQIGYLVAAIGAFSISIKVQTWMGVTRPSMAWLLRLYGISVLYKASEPLLHIFHLQAPSANEVMGFFMLIGLGIALSSLMKRVSDVLDVSYRTSITDGLTGLFDKRYFNKALQRFVERGVQVAVLFIDLDNFKKLNDTKGHDAGDEALKTVAQILKEQIEGKGIAGRYGGEEMVLMVSKPMMTIEDFAEQVRFRIERESIVTASIGFAEWAPGVTVEQLVKNADSAMYFSKQNGKNRVTGYRP
jgi:two-component system cell cycle response regulator